MRAPSTPQQLALEVNCLARERGSLLVLSDFDGTLAPIVSTPGAARIQPALVRLLQSIAARPRTGLAIISGRSLEDVRNRVGVPGLIYAGCHGLIAEGPGISFVHPEAAAARELVEDITAQLRERFRGLSGVEIEPKELCVCVHYRRARPSDLAEVFFQVESIADTHQERIMSLHGKKVFELLPRVSWDKGESALWIRDHWSRRVSQEPATVFMGDDETDERAFEALRGKGLTVRVGSGRRRSAASRWVTDVRAVHEFLTLLDGEDIDTRSA
jgi:trehalose-phosphatase